MSHFGRVISSILLRKSDIEGTQWVRNPRQLFGWNNKIITISIGRVSMSGKGKRPKGKPSRKPSGKSRKSKSPTNGPMSLAEVYSSKYLRLLSDPCGAELVNSTFEGTNGTYLLRTRQFFNLGAFQDLLFQFCPSAGGHATQFSCGSVLTGGALGLPATSPLPSFLTGSIVGSFRCIAACVRPHYIGTELDRKGIVGLSIVTGQQINNTLLSNPLGSYIAGSQRLARFGSENHEVRWCPNESDADFQSVTNPGTITTGTSTGNAILVAVQGCPASTLSVEINGCWEWTPDMNTNPGLPNVVSAPKSTATLNTTLSKIQNLVEFATHPDMIAAAKGAMKFGNMFMSRSSGGRNYGRLEL